MTLRPDSFADVPLPHGTEVTTLAEKQHAGQRVARGLVGRVVRAKDGGHDVLITGLGELWYARDEVAPRRAGQLEFARSREAAWQALWPCRVLEATVGSRAWGLADASSDTDLRGAFALPFTWSQGLVRAPDSLVSADGSQTYWAHHKLVEQALRADPNTLELLFVPSVRALDVIGQWVLETREAFVSKLLFGSFGRYALSQLEKLSSAQRLAEHRDQVLAWLQADPTLTLEQVAERLAVLSHPPLGERDNEGRGAEARSSPELAPAKRDNEGRGAEARSSPELAPANAVHQAKLYLKQLYRSLEDQGLLDRGDFAALVHYAQHGGRRPPDARHLRPKNAYNLLRLLALATGWLETGAPVFEASGTFRDTLLTIKRGEVPLETVLELARQMAPALEAARDRSPLPEHPDFAAADALLHRIGFELARRAVESEPGPWGREAPKAPLARSVGDAGRQPEGDDAS